MVAPVELSRLISTDPLPRELEIELARAMRAGDDLARELLTRGSLRLVALRVLALGINPSGRDDAFQSGVLGLMAAIERFDPDRGVRLATYAWPWITASVRSGVPRPVRPVPADDASPSEPDESDVRGDLRLLIAGLPSLMIDVMRLRFGLGDGSDVLRSRASVAARLGLTVSEVRSVEANALSTLRRRLARLGHRAPGLPGADPL